MATATVTNTLHDAGGNAVVHAPVVALLYPDQPAFDPGGHELVSRYQVITDASGVWSMTLERTDTMTPSGMTYAIYEPNNDGSTHLTYIILPVGGGTLAALAVAAPPPGVPGSIMSVLGSGGTTVTTVGNTATVHSAPSIAFNLTEAPYNCDPTGVADATAGIQAAVTAAIAVKGTVTGRGSFKVTAEITGTGSLTIRGDGQGGLRFLNAIPGTGPHYIFNFGNGSTAAQVNIIGVEIDGQNNNETAGIRYQAGTSGLIANNNIHNVDKIGIRAGFGSPGYETWIAQNHIENLHTTAGNYSILVDSGADATHIWDNEIYGGPQGIHLTGSGYVQVIRNHITGCVGHGIEAVAQSWCEIDQNEIVDLTGFGVFIHDGTQNAVRNNVIKDASNASTTYDFITVRNEVGTLVQGNVVHLRTAGTIGRYGIAEDGTSDQNKILNNAIEIDGGGNFGTGRLLIGGANTVVIDPGNAGLINIVKGLVVNGTAQILAGTGSPAGAVAAPVGSIYLNLSGGAATTLYVKESGTAGNTGWVGK